MNDKKMLLIGAALLGTWYLYNKSKAQVTINPRSSIMPVYQPTTTQQQLINTGITTAGSLLQNLLQPKTSPPSTYLPDQSSIMPVYQQPTDQANFDQSSYDNFNQSDPSMFLGSIKKSPKNII